MRLRRRRNHRNSAQPGSVVAPFSTASDRRAADETASRLVCSRRSQETGGGAPSALADSVGSHAHTAQA